MDFFDCALFFRAIIPPGTVCLEKRALFLYPVNPLCEPLPRMDKQDACSGCVQAQYSLGFNFVFHRSVSAHSAHGRDATWLEARFRGLPGCDDGCASLFISWWSFFHHWRPGLALDGFPALLSGLQYSFPILSSRLH